MSPTRRSDIFDEWIAALADTSEASSAAVVDKNWPALKRPRFVVRYHTVLDAASQSEAGSLAARDGVLSIVRGTAGAKWLVLRCPCGCGQIRRVSTAGTVRPNWRLQIDRNGQASLFPSVWLISECRAHFVLRSSRAFVF